MSKQHAPGAPRRDEPVPGASPRVADLVPGMRIQGVYVVKKKVCREQPGGARFLLFQFGDRSGTVNGVMWDGVDRVEREVTAGDLAHLQGEVQLYQNTRQVKVHQLVRADPTAFDLSAFLPTSGRDLDALYEALLATVDSVADPSLRRLYGELFRDPELRQRFRCAPAGKGWHHAYVGGLLEHVVAMLELGEVMAQQHPELDRDLLIGGILLHDIGKVEELIFKSHIDYTNAGRLVGHLVQGCILVSRYMDRIEGFPEELRTRVLHMIVSHHGAPERGSPKPPMTLEATIVHLLDHLDSQAHGVEQVVGRRGGEDGWSEHVKLLDRYFYRGSPERRNEGGSTGV
jgi:3'-5' exoribonuclease